MKSSILFPPMNLATQTSNPLARSFAQMTLDFQAFEHAFIPEYEQKPHPALYLQLHTTGGHFPHTLTVSSFTVSSNNLQTPLLPPTPYASFYLKFDLKRPDYSTPNDPSIRGNHVIVELLHLIKEHIEQLTRDRPVHVFTGRLKWADFISTPEYQSLLEQRLLHAQIQPPAPSQKPRIRL